MAGAVGKVVNVIGDAAIQTMTAPIDTLKAVGVPVPIEVDDFGSRMRRKLFRLKPLESAQNEAEQSRALDRSLTWWDLVTLGIGCIIGAGIFVLTGVAARQVAGPAIAVSYLVAGITCVFAALCYAEFAARVPLSGSAYTYAYLTVGEFPGWVIGWDLTLEYTLAVAAVARGWSGYVTAIFSSINVTLPTWMYKIEFSIFNLDLMAASVVSVITVMLIYGTKMSARFNGVVVVISIIVIVFVIVAGIFFVDVNNYTPFAPYGGQGIFEGAAIVFFAFIGFDAVTCTAEECKNPQRDLPIGIVGSLLVSSVLYISVALVICGMVPYNMIDLNAPLAVAFADKGLRWASALIALGAFAALTTTILVNAVSQPRIYYSMARDGLLPEWFARINPKFKTPVNSTIVTGVMATILTFVLDITALADMVSIGTLMAFTIVSGCILSMRYVDRDGSHTRTNAAVGMLIAFSALFAISYVYSWPLAITIIFLVLILIPVTMLYRMPQTELPKSFVCPLVPFVPCAGVVCNLFLMINLHYMVWIRFAVWLGIGLLVYFFYGIRHSRLETTVNPVMMTGRDSYARFEDMTDDDEDAIRPVTADHFGHTSGSAGGESHSPVELTPRGGRHTAGGSSRHSGDERGASSGVGSVVSPGNNHPFAHHETGLANTVVSPPRVSSGGASGDGAPPSKKASPTVEGHSSEGGGRERSNSREILLSEKIAVTTANANKEDAL